ncbi:hypothetical protein H8E07_13710 [bacterium]|nr:hypothetical protein [bacterium]
MARKSRTTGTAIRIALAIWSVLLPILPGPAGACEPPAAEPAHPPACCCCEEAPAAPPCCAQEAVPPCAGGSCVPCPLTGGALVYLAPESVGLEGPDALALIRPDDQSPGEVFYTPPNPPPQPTVLS